MQTFDFTDFDFHESGINGLFRQSLPTYVDFAISRYEIDDCTSREAHSCNRYHELRPGNKRSLTSWAMGIQRIVQENI